MNLYADLHRSLLNVCTVKIMLYTRFQEMGVHVFCRRMLSPIGMNAHFVCDFYDVSMCDISVISKSLAWSVHNDKVIAPELDNIDMIKELLHVKFGHSVLLHLDSVDIDIVIEQLCTE